MFTELPLLERPAAARVAGFDAVEFWWPWSVAVPSEQEIADFTAAIRDAGVQLIGLNFFAGDMPGGDRGLVSWGGREDEFRANVPVAIAIGAELGCKAFNALYGNRQEGQDPAGQDALAVENLVIAANAAAEIDVVVLLEPVSGTDAYPLKLAADVVAVLEKVHARGAANVAFLLDLYHLAANGEDLEQACVSHAATAGHCQIGDAPGRGEPGTGELPLQALLGTMRDTGYDGWVALEYKPTVPTAESFGNLPKLD